MSEKLLAALTNPGAIVQVSTDAAGGAASLYSYSDSPIFSPDGTRLVFYSEASNLVPGDTNGVGDVFIKDLNSGTIGRVSTSATGGQGNGLSFWPAFSPDGLRVAFSSEASNLVLGDTNGVRDIFVKDLMSGAIVRVSVDATGSQADGPSSAPSFSPDGMRIAFHSDASNLVPNDKNGTPDIFVKHLLSGDIVRVSTDATGGQTNSSFGAPVFSPDGMRVAFSSEASNLVPGDTNGVDDIFVKDLISGAIVRVSTDASGGEGNNRSSYPIFSPDGTRIAFQSDASNLVPGDTNAVRDAFIKDLISGAIVRVSTDATGGQADNMSFGPVFSSDGTRVAFTSEASNLVPGDTNGVEDVFVKDLISGAIVRVSTSATGGQGNGNSFWPAFSPDGVRVAFASSASNLVPGDSNISVDIFIKNVAAVTSKSLPSDLTSEYLARVTAYERGLFYGQNGAGDTAAVPGVNHVAAGYKWVRDFTVAAQPEFYAVALEAPDKHPVLAIRGTTGPIIGTDWYQNADIQGVGYSEVDAAWLGPDGLLAWLQAHPNASITGHSQGGAQAQIVAARATQQGLQLGNVVTFNATGVSSAVENLFDGSKVVGVRHYISSGDIVSHAGEEFLPGSVIYYNFDSLAPALSRPYRLIGDAHTAHWAQPDLYARIDGDGVTEDITPSGAGNFDPLDNFRLTGVQVSEDQLSSPLFSHLYSGGELDLEFAALLHFIARLGPNFAAAAPVLSAAVSPVAPLLAGAINALAPVAKATTPVVAALLSTREGTEALRTGVGAVGQGVEALLGLPQQMLDAAKQFFDLIVSLGDYLEDLAVQLAAAVAEGVQTAIAWLATGAEFFANLSVDAWIGFSAWTEEKLQAVRDYAVAAIDAIADWGAAQWNAIENWTKDQLLAIQNMTGDIWATTVHWGQTAFDNLAAGGVAAGQKALDAFDAIGNAVQSTAQDAAWGVLKTADSFWGWATGLNDVVVVQASPNAPVTFGPAVLIAAASGSTMQCLAPGSLYFTGAGIDTIIMNSGGNVIYGSPVALHNTSIQGFGPTDKILIGGVSLNANKLVITKGSAILDLDTDGDGTPDTQIVLEGDYDLSDFVLTPSNAGTIITYEPANDPPTPQPDVYAVARGRVASIDAANGLGANDSDPDGDALSFSLVSGPSAGSVVVNADGSFTYTADGSLAVLDTFTYRATDPGGLFADATVTLTVEERAETIDGTEGPDTIFGYGLDDRLFGRAGDDTISGGDGNDRIFDPEGNNILNGDAGNDIIYAGSGTDTIDGGAGDDILNGAGGNDTVLGGEGRDKLYGGAGDDTLDGGSGNDNAQGGAGNDIIDGGDGNDFLFGNDGDDTIMGGDGNDQIFGDAGNDDLNGGAGNDIVRGGSGQNRIDGGSGLDVLFGGADQDTFVLANAFADRDWIHGFQSGTDLLEIDAALFGGGLAPGALDPSRLVANSNPVATAPGQFLFNTANGTLRFDADGAGGAAPATIAALVGVSSLSAADFIIV
jgi:Ca2+-binding RTX toxin-like protein/Tol biopolymer transport system component